MKVLVACEESQRVCTAFRKRGHEAYSCDIQDCSGGHPEWHIKDDVLLYLNPKKWFNRYGIIFQTMDNVPHFIDGKWDLIIAHPPCTYLSNAATRSFSLRVTPPDKVVERWENRAKAAIFFMYFVLADCDRICVENPVGFMNSWKKPTQIIHPYYFVDSPISEDYKTKRTCLWLKGLTPLQKTNELPKPSPLRSYITKNGKIKGVQWCDSITTNRAKERSKTFNSIAKAMAEQWGVMK